MKSLDESLALESSPADNASREDAFDLDALLDEIGSDEDAIPTEPPRQEDSVGANKDSSSRSRALLVSRPKWVLPVLVGMGAILLGVFIARLFLFSTYVLVSESMHPTIGVGDTLVAGGTLFSGGSAVDSGDIVVFTDAHGWSADADFLVESSAISKRVIAVGGDEVSGLEDGTILVNDDPVLFPTSSLPYEQSWTVTVPTGTLFVMGDNRAVSVDSAWMVVNGRESVAFIDEDVVLGRGWLSISGTSVRFL